MALGVPRETSLQVARSVTVMVSRWRDRFNYSSGLLGFSRNHAFDNSHSGFPIVSQ